MMLSTHIDDVLWRELGKSQESDPKTDSERLLCEYMKREGYDFCYEPAWRDKKKRPDFVVRFNGRGYVLEVKAPPAEHPNPSETLRPRIQEARKKFKEFKEFSCSLVVWNAGGAATACDPRFIFAAMFGDLGVTIPLNVRKGEIVGPARSVLLPQGGSMVRSYDSGERQNKTISAIIALDEETIWDEQFESELQQIVQDRERKLGHSLSPEERAAERVDLFKLRTPSNEHVPKVTVCENPEARIPLSRDLFADTFSQRYAFAGENVELVYGESRLEEVL